MGAAHRHPPLGRQPVRIEPAPQWVQRVAVVAMRSCKKKNLGSGKCRRLEAGDASSR
jgi:hypothetical protein